MENVKEMTLVGFYNFKSKDGKKVYYVVQCLVNDVLGNDYCKGNLINVFVEENIYVKIVNEYDIGSAINVESKINYSTGKVYYSIVL